MCIIQRPGTTAAVLAFASPDTEADDWAAGACVPDLPAGSGSAGLDVERAPKRSRASLRRAESPVRNA